MNFLPNPIALSIPLPFSLFGQTTLPIYWYGIMIVLGAVSGAFVATREARRRGQDPEHVWNALLFALILGVIGARLYHVLSDVAQGDPLGYFSKDPGTNLVAMLNPRSGGLGIFGAVVGGLLGLYVYARYAKLRFWQWVDIAMPGLAIGQAIGRWGNFFNQELYGYPTDLPWGIPIDTAHRLPQFAGEPPTTRFHPTFLYESLAMLGVAALLLYIARRYTDRLKAGDMLLLYGIFYSLVRFFTEMQRPDAWRFSDIPVAQIISITVFVICGVWFAYRHTGPASTTRTTTQRTSTGRSRNRRRTGSARPTRSEELPASRPATDKPAEETKS